MNEHKEPIPSRIYNSAVDGHVCGEDDIDFYKPASTGTSGENPYNGIGQVVFKKNLVNGVNTLIQDMINQADTKYIIKYDFDLGGDEITIPANCVLQFEGGSLSNGTLALNDCYLSGMPKFNTIIFSGNIKNDLFDCTWIENGDIGYKINKANENFRNLLVPSGEFVYETPVDITVNRLECNADLSYNGTYTNNKGVFIIRGWSAYIHVHKLVPNNRSAISYLDTRTVNAIGVEITDCNNCQIHIDNVEYFNENLRISDINSGGCCYNKFFIGVLASGNANIRLYQQDSEGESISWVNENTFIGGRLTHWTDSVSWGEYWNVVVGGPALDKPSYKNEGATDGEDTCNGLTFIGTSIESNRVTLLLRNVAESQFIGMRQETSPGFAKIVGRFYNIYYVSKFADRNNILNSDFSEATNVNIFNYKDIYTRVRTINIDDNLTADRNLIKFSGYVCDPSKLRDMWIRNNTTVGMLLSISSKGICFAVELNKGTRLTIRLLDSEGNNITENYSSLIVGYNIPYNNDKKAFFSAGDSASNQIHIPYDSSISKVFVGCGSEIGVKLTVYSTRDAEVPTIIRYGTTANRPIALPANIAYFDTDLGRPIYTKSTQYNNPSATKWVDDNGFSAAPNRGTTLNRPKGSGATGGVLDATNDVGFEYYDTDLNKQIFAKSISVGGTVVWVEEDGAVAGVTRIGTTANRPSGSDVYVGFEYFDTDLGESVVVSAINGSEASWITKSTYTQKSIYIDENVMTNGNLCSFSGFVCNATKVVDTNISYLAKIGAIVDTSIVKTGYAQMTIKKRFYVVYLDSENNNISENYSSSLPSSKVSYNSSHKCFVSNSDTNQLTFTIPDSISRVLIGIGYGNENTLTIVTKGAIISVPTISTSGTTASRPSFFPVNKSYFDTDLKKPIFYIGNGWVDAVGNDVSTAYITKSGTLVSGNVPEFDGTDGAVKDSGKAATNIP